MQKKIYSSFVLITLLALFACSKDVVMKPAALSNFQPTAVVNKQWSNSVNMVKGAYLKLSPIAANNKIFIAGTSGNIKAIDTNTGNTLWQVNTKMSLSSGPGINNTAVFVGTSDGQIIALQQQDGKILWQGNVIGDVLAAPAANNETVVVKTSVGKIRAFNTRTGKVLWDYAEQNPSLSLRGSSAPKIVDDQVICGFANGEMVALDIDNGSVKWQQQIATPNGSFEVERMVDIVADPVVSGSTIYVVTYQGNIAALNIKNGNILWQKPMSSISGLSFDTQNIYVTNSHDQLFALTKSDGDTIWHYDGFAYRGLSGPATLGNVVAVGDTEGYVHWLNTANGQIAARTKISGSIVVTPITYNNALYVYSTTGNLVKFTK